MSRLHLTVLVVGFLNACSMPPPVCGPSTCQGCCDSSGQCVQAQSSSQCGSGGSLCTACGTGSVCVVGTCMTQGGSGGGSASSGGGQAAGGDAGGSTAGGSTAGGSTAGGSTAGGSTAGGSAGGSTAGGSTAGGATAGGSTAGGSAGGATAGGSTAGGSAGGSTAGGSAAGGSAAGGSAAGGSAAGGSAAGGSAAGGSAAGGSAAGGSAAGGSSGPDAGVPACGGTLIRCGSVCLDQLSDENNCGGCGSLCSSGQVCTAGTCRPLPTDCVVAGGCAPGFSCDPVTRTCSAGCRINSECPQGATCSGNTCTCPSGQHACGQTCVPNTAINSCGPSSCSVCPSEPNAVAACTNQQCTIDCNPGFLRCGSACVACSAPANGTPSCAGTTCDFTCNAGFRKCGTGCATCPTIPANASPVCTGTTCDFACNVGFHRCGNQCLPDDSVLSCGTRCSPCTAIPGFGVSCSGVAGSYFCSCSNNAALCGSTCVPQVLYNCSSRGTCSDSTGAPVCTCNPGFGGPECGQCSAGFQDNDNNQTCLPTCAAFSPSSCSGHGTCSDASGTAACTCQAGWVGPECATQSTAGFVKVSSGSSHSCGLRSNGAVECWGVNFSGQTNVPAGLVAQDIATGSAWSCALPTSGGVRCWGQSLNGGVVMDTAPNKPASGAFAAIYGGGEFACVVTAALAVTCFGESPPSLSNVYWVSGRNSPGSNSYAALDGTSGAITSVNVSGTRPTTPNGYALVECGSFHCCAIRETRASANDRLQGRVDCWGPAGGPALSGVPTTTFAAVSSGADVSCGIVSTPGVATDLQLSCWGSTFHGVPGNRPSGQFVSVALGSTHACAVTPAGVIRCWGSSTSGQAPPVRY